MDEYQAQALRSADGGLSLDLNILKDALGLAGEAGEVADAVKKWYFHGHELDIEAVKKELGDIMWYIASMAKLLGYPLSEIAVCNVDKLKKRYPNGFSHEASRERVE